MLRFQQVIKKKKQKSLGGYFANTILESCYRRTSKNNKTTLYIAFFKILIQKC